MNLFVSVIVPLVFGAMVVAAPPKWPVAELVDSSDVILEGGLFRIFEPTSFQLFQLSATNVLKGGVRPASDYYVITAGPSFHEGPQNPGPIPLFGTHLLFLQEVKPTQDELTQAPSLKQASKVFRLAVGAQGVLTTAIVVPEDKKAQYLQYFPEGMSDKWQQETISRCNINRYLRGSYGITSPKEAIALVRVLVSALLQVKEKPELFKDILAMRGTNKLVDEVLDDIKDRDYRNDIMGPSGAK